MDRYILGGPSRVKVYSIREQILTIRDSMTRDLMF